MENNINKDIQPETISASSGNMAEPYVGMPVNLDDSFFEFMGNGTEVDCFIENEKDMDDIMFDCDDYMVDEENYKGCKPGNGNKPPDAGGKPDVGGSIDDCVGGCPLAMAYVPWQKWVETYDMEKGFKVGTIFPCLDLPFTGGGRR